MDKSDVETKIIACFTKPMCTSLMPSTKAPTSALIPPMDEESAESILDQHCSRIWASSSHHTPSYSPTGSPPHSKSPDRHQRKKTIGLSASVSTPNAYSSRAYHKKRDFSSVSYDSGIENCNLIVGTETHRHIHHHHHHHHSARESSNKKNLVEVEAQTTWRADNPSNTSDYPDNAGRGRTSVRKSNVLRKTCETSSNIDSGISGMESVKLASNWNNPTSEKYVYFISLFLTLII